MLALSAAGFVAIAAFLWGSQIERVTTTFADWVGKQACDRAAGADEAARGEVSRFPVAVAVFDASGREVAASRSPALPPLSASTRARIREGSLPIEPARIFPVTCPGDASRYALVGGPPIPAPLERLGFLVAALVLLVTVASIPLARSLVRPLRELLSTVQRVGAGDLSARAQARRGDEIGDLARAFNDMAANLEGHILAEKELLANVSHELRTPLARIRVVLETAEAAPDRTVTLLREIARDVKDLEQLTDDVLATTRLDFAGASVSGSTLRIRPERVDVVDVLRRAVVRFAEDNPEREIELDAVVEIAPVDGDPSLLLRLFGNLLENARKYSTGKILARVCAADDGTLSIDVEDQGIGIDASDLERIFEPFFRSDRGRSTAAMGSGLGLTLCRRIVELHHGTIGARSREAGGTTVTVRLPADG